MSRTKGKVMTKQKNSLVKSIKEDLTDKRQKLATIKAEELRLVQDLTVIRKRRKDLEKSISDDEDYVERIERLT